MREYSSAPHCILCNEVEDHSVGLYLNLSVAGICNECTENMEFNEIIEPDEDGVYHFTSAQLSFILEEFSKHTMRMIWDPDRLSYAHGRVSDEFYKFLKDVCPEEEQDV